MARKIESVNIGPEIEPEEDDAAEGGATTSLPADAADTLDEEERGISRYAARSSRR